MSENYPSRVAEKIVVRLPDGMRDRLGDAAKQNQRSVNAEVVARLLDSFLAEDSFFPRNEDAAALIREAQQAFEQSFREGLALAAEEMKRQVAADPSMIPQFPTKRAKIKRR